MAVFDFCPNRLVAETLPPEPVAGMSMNGWQFSSKPKVPFQQSFKVTLHGLTWYLQSNGLYDSTTNLTFNARRFELFYQAHGTWDEFSWTHPHLGALSVKFKTAVAVPKALVNSSGLIEAFEIMLINSNPGY